MVNIETMISHHRKHVVDLSVNDEQRHFVSHIKDILASPQVHLDPHVILVEEQVVGFFNIDTAYGQYYDFAGASSLGLRSYFIESSFQG